MAFPKEQRPRKVMKKCSCTKKYKATRPPKCGCDYCELIWLIKGKLDK